MRLEGKTALITGGGSGLGEATAILFANEGAEVIIADIVDEDGKYVEEKITGSGKTAMFVHCNVTDAAQVENAVKQGVDRFGTIDILVSNAGVNAVNDSLPHLELEEWDRVFNVNAKAHFLCCRHVVPAMKEQKYGSIVIVSSNGALYGAGGGYASRSSKGALLTLTRLLAIELASSNVRVNCVCPGAMDTPMRHEAAKIRPVVSPSTVPLGRIADPMEVAYCILFLASDEASYVTGTTLVADGGRVAM
jgi:NAD(P)-dependent dehydrogenase (short-subunit alcohol dehydrogenase family)